MPIEASESASFQKINRRSLLMRVLLRAGRVCLKAAAGGMVAAVLFGVPQVFTPGLVPAVFAQNEKVGMVTHITSPLEVDGVLDEIEWGAAPVLGEIVQREPHTGAAATERTEVRVLYSDDFLYIGVVCLDSEPARIIGTRMARDSSLDDDDKVEIVLDPYRDRRNGFYFATNPLGNLVDGLIVENGNLNRDWDTIWMVRTRRTEAGWTAEFAIPFKSLSFNPGQSRWGFNIARTIKRKFEEDRWASPRLDTKLLQVSEAGELDGFGRITGYPPLPFRALVEVLSNPTQHANRQARARHCLQHDSKPEADRHGQHRLWRNGSRCAAD
jgi:hypothetical protein